MRKLAMSLRKFFLVEGQSFTLSFFHNPLLGDFAGGMINVVKFVFFDRKLNITYGLSEKLFFFFHLCDFPQSSKRTFLPWFNLNPLHDNYVQHYPFGDKIGQKGQTNLLDQVWHFTHYTFRMSYKRLHSATDLVWLAQCSSRIFSELNLGQLWVSCSLMF